LVQFTIRNGHHGYPSVFAEVDFAKSLGRKSIDNVVSYKGIVDGQGIVGSSEVPVTLVNLIETHANGHLFHHTFQEAFFDKVELIDLQVPSFYPSLRVVTRREVGAQMQAYSICQGSIYVQVGRAQVEV
jgi:hypothetical protein